MPNRRIEITNYTSDSPGYCGAISMEIDGKKLTIDTSEISEVTLPQPAGVLVGTRTANQQDIQNIFECLAVDRDWQEYYEKVEYIDTGRVMMLQFQGGDEGFVLFGGESCFFLLKTDKGFYSIETEGEGQVVEIG